MYVHVFQKKMPGYQNSKQKFDFQLFMENSKPQPQNNNPKLRKQIHLGCIVLLPQFPIFPPALNMFANHKNLFLKIPYLNLTLFPSSGVSRSVALKGALSLSGHVR